MVLEAANAAGLDASRVRRLGIPDRFIEHGERKELLTDLGLDEAGVLATCSAQVAEARRKEGRVEKGEGRKDRGQMAEGRW